MWDTVDFLVSSPLPVMSKFFVGTFPLETRLDIRRTGVVSSRFGLVFKSIGKAVILVNGGPGKAIVVSTKAIVVISGTLFYRKDAGYLGIAIIGTMLVGGQEIGALMFDG